MFAIDVYEFSGMKTGVVTDSRICETDTNIPFMPYP